MKNNKILKWIFLVFWMAVIFMFSHQPNSGEITHNIIQKLIPNVQTNALIDIINFIIRKSAHLTEYFILTFLIVSLLKEYTKNERIIILVSLIFCFLYSLTDEYHQSFILGRTSSIKDVLIDTIGGLLFVIAYKLYQYKKRFYDHKSS